MQQYEDNGVIAPAILGIIPSNLTVFSSITTRCVLFHWLFTTDPHSTGCNYQPITTQDSSNQLDATQTDEIKQNRY